MMDGMVFWSLDEQAKPLWRSYVGVIEILTHRSEEGGPSSGHGGSTKHTVDEEPSQDRVGSNFDGMLVERCNQFDSGWAVMDLVEDQPETVRVSDSVPPVKDERANEPVESAFRYRVGPLPKFKQSMASKVAVPSEAAKANKGQLHEVHQSGANVPAC